MASRGTGAWCVGTASARTNGSSGWRHLYDSAASAGWPKWANKKGGHG